MELGSVVQYIENKTILVTGATGHLAKIFVEKILRAQPNLKKLYLLLRAADAKSATERFYNEVIEKELFKVLKEKIGASFYSFVSEKVTPVHGDISDEDLGVKDHCLRAEMWKEIDLVVNFAATTSFDERYDVALAINTFGALNVLNFSKRCAKIKMVVHVSTAYVCGEEAGVIEERPFFMGEAKKGNQKIDIEAEQKLAKQKLCELKSKDVAEEAIASAMKDFGIERARVYGWPNTYSFTKAMGEMLATHARDNNNNNNNNNNKISLLIVRPAIVASTYKEPFPGWIEGLRTIDGIMAGYAKGKVTCFFANPQSILDVIPADMVVNAIIVAMVAHSIQPSHKFIYHLGSSLRNPVKFSNLHDFGFRYFSHNPFIGKDGKPVIVGKGKILSTMPSFHLFMAIRFLLPLKVLQFVNVVSFQNYNDKLAVLRRRKKLVMRLVDLYKPYVFFEGIFDDTNTEVLRMVGKQRLKDADAFNFDTKAIEWEDYLMNIHLPGLVQHVMRG